MVRIPRIPRQKPARFETTGSSEIDAAINVLFDLISVGSENMGWPNFEREYERALDTLQSGGWHILSSEEEFEARQLLASAEHLSPWEDFPRKTFMPGFGNLTKAYHTDLFERSLNAADSDPKNVTKTTILRFSGRSDIVARLHWSNRSNHMFEDLKLTCAFDDEASRPIVRQAMQSQFVWQTFKDNYEASRERWCEATVRGKRATGGRDGVEWSFNGFLTGNTILQLFEELNLPPCQGALTAELEARSV
jgi:hypothetical protein